MIKRGSRYLSTNIATNFPTLSQGALLKDFTGVFVNKYRKKMGG